VAKSQFDRRHILGFARSALVGLALIQCGTQTGAGSGAAGRAIQPAPFCVAAIEGTPEAVALARAHCSDSSAHVAPIEGSPEQTIVDMAR
jgi:hypothetical protein